MEEVKNNSIDLANNVSGDRIILGIDVSTACLGTSLVKVSNGKMEVLKISYVKPKVPRNVKGTDALFIKTKQFKEQIIKQYEGIGLTDIIIEEPLPNSFNLNTVATLLRFNGMISQSIYELTGVSPKFISSYDARKFAFPELMAVRKFNKKGDVYPKDKVKKDILNNKLVLFGAYPFDVEKKHILQAKISELFPHINWEYNKNGELKTENFDVSDSLVCILGYLNKEFYKDSKATIKSYEETELPIKEGNITRFSYVVNFCDKDIEKYLDV